MDYEKNILIDGVEGIAEFRCKCTCNGGQGHSGNHQTDAITFESKTHQDASLS